MTKEELKDLLQQIFLNASSKEEVRIACKVYGIELVSRGQNVTATKDNLKCRLRTLGLHDLYAGIGKDKEQSKTPEKPYYNPKEDREQTPLTPDEREERRKKRKAEMDEIYRQKKERGDRGRERTRER